MLDLLLQLRSQRLHLSLEPVSLQVLETLQLLELLFQGGELSVSVPSGAEQRLPLRLQGCQAAADLRPLLQEQQHRDE